MDELWREKKRKDRPKELYPDVSCKGAPVPPALPVPNCDCGKPAVVTQSMHPETAARAYYMCGDYRRWEMCNFFQWVDGPEMVDPRIPHFKQWGTTPYERFERWVPPPPNPPAMTTEEKKEAIARRMANPPLCKCGVPAQIHRMVEGSPFTPTFECRNRTKNGYPLCDFSEYDYGPKSYWPDSSGKKKGKEKVRYFAPEKKCRCGVVANHGLVPSELGIGDYCGHMVGDDLGTRRCDWEYFIDKHEVDHEIKWRSQFGKHPNVLHSYLRCRKQSQREAARKRGMWPRPKRDSKDKWVEPLFQQRKKKQKRGEEGQGPHEEVDKVAMETMKGLVGNLPVLIPDDDD